MILVNFKKSVPVTALVAVVGVLIFAGCTSEPLGMVDCGNDIMCFQERAETCSPAKVQFSLVDILRQAGLEELGDQMGMDMVFYEEIKGGTAENCTLYARIDEIRLMGIGELTQEEQMSFNMMKGIIEGKEMTCNLPVTQMSGAMSVYGNTTFDITEYCTGSLIDLQESLSGGFTPN